MKILFICGSLEPGKDGVGDYTRRLAGEIINQGHEVALIAMNERCLKDVIKQDDRFKNILRLPAIIPWRAKEEDARNFIDVFKPDFISLQFVIYGWHDKGLPLFLPKMLDRISQGYKLHLMFHELSIGISQGVTIKETLIGFVQRQLVIKPLLKLKNLLLIDTQSSVYQHLLEKWTEKKVNLKPLFGNIPVIDANALVINKWVDKFLGVNKEEYMIAGYFGSIYQPCLNKEVFIKLKSCADKKQKKLMICSAGGISKDRESDFMLLNNEFPMIQFIRLGRLDVNDVSLYLSSLNCGLSGTSYLLIEKSGSAAAMFEHDVNVVSTSNYFKVNNIDSLSPEVEKYIYSDLADCNFLDPLKNETERKGVALITTQILTSMVS
jgi:hypothetical protein